MSPSGSSVQTTHGTSNIWSSSVMYALMKSSFRSIGNQYNLFAFPSPIRRGSGTNMPGYESKAAVNPLPGHRGGRQGWNATRKTFRPELSARIFSETFPRDMLVDVNCLFFRENFFLLRVRRQIPYLPSFVPLRRQRATLTQGNSRISEAGRTASGRNSCTERQRRDNRYPRGRCNPAGNLPLRKGWQPMSCSIYEY